ncbi:nucleoside-diphosphate-sugar epimerase [Okibacterium sp. HSC-33S16]|uniref:NAD-dependent epimerase/dehydratase family protein n=1 Tax=Okibacterium sp. HSC-33S16 TaxID=2910965 RepID=UPI00209F696A|nr:NAD-dependent epimerase/dehydratase family protein [Okibacterium sp. HSC-33S16]MCP2031368.1 nucleoside-diphosphate-sugar epimerase [Okibacterium sp. HSC-33S16]
MSAQSVLVLGGTGIISSASVALAAERGWEVTVVNRGRSESRPLGADIETLEADVRDPESLSAAIGNRNFDVVADFLSFTPDQLHLDAFRDRTGQYIFISSASAYQKPPAYSPVTESTPLRNPFWEYSRNKIACEDVLVAEYRASGYPITIVRPSHTYDRTALPTLGGWTDIERMRRGLPVVVHGDGTTQWTITHTRDFAVGFVGLFGRDAALGDTFHITGDQAPTWDAIYAALGRAAGVEPVLVHVPSDAIAAAAPDLGPGLLGDKAHSMVFDNSKLKALVPDFRQSTFFEDGAREIIEWYDADASRRVVDSQFDELSDSLFQRFGA